GRGTGGLFETERLPGDGRAPGMRPDGAVVAYETVASAAVVPRLVQVAGERAVLAELPGIGAVIAPSGKKVVYLKLPPIDEIKKAQAELDSGADQGAGRNPAQQTLNYLQSKHGVVTLRDLQTRQEKELQTATFVHYS